MQLNRGRFSRHGDDGFTLIELVMTVAILGIVSAALFGVMFQYLKTTSDTSARLNESTDEQFISTYWQNDVSSLGRRSFASGALTVAPSVFVGSAGPTGCGSSAGSVVVAFAWSQFPTNPATPADAWVSTPQEVAYVTAPSSGTRLVLKRVRCNNGVAGTPLVVAHNLTSPPIIACDTTCGTTPLPNRVSMSFTVKDADNAQSAGYTTTVSADRRQEQ